MVLLLGALLGMKGPCDAEHRDILEVVVAVLYNLLAATCCGQLEQLQGSRPSFYTTACTAYVHKVVEVFKVHPFIMKGLVHHMHVC